MTLNKHRNGGRINAMRKDDEKPLIPAAIWLISCLALIMMKHVTGLDVSWGIVTLPLWGPLLIGVLMYAIVGE